MDVSVIIPTLNGGERFCEMLPRVFEQRLDHRLEVICIDSGSVDGTPDFAAKAGARVISIDPSRFNHGLTRNLGIEECSGEFVVLTVQDALPMDDRWLEALVQALEQDPNHAGSYSRQFPRPECHPIIRDRLMNWSACREEQEVQGLDPGQSLEDLHPMERLKRIAFDNVSSCVRRSTWELFPFARRSFGEDIAWAHDVVQAGYRIVFTPDSMVEHSHNNSIWYEFKRIYADHQNLNQLIGVQTVPQFRQIFSNAQGAFTHYRALIHDQLNSPTRRRISTFKAFIYAHLENLAQYLGPRIYRYADSKHGFAIGLDCFLKSGV